MRNLTQTLHWMQAVITHPQGVSAGITSSAARQRIELSPERADEVVTRSATLSGIERLEIYAYAYHARLLECMREEFPVVKSVLEDELFDEFVLGYLQKYPSTSYTLFELGSRFPQYLRESRPERDPETSDEPDWADFLIELTEWERVFNEVFDGPGLEGRARFSARDLMQIPADQFLDVKLVCSPALKLLSFQFPVPAFFSEMRRGREPSRPEPRETFVALCRAGYRVKSLDLVRPAYEILKGLQLGQPMGLAIASAAAHADLHSPQFLADLQTWFQEWTEAGCFQGLSVVTAG